MVGTISSRHFTPNISNYPINISASQTKQAASYLRYLQISQGSAKFFQFAAIRQILIHHKFRFWRI